MARSATLKQITDYYKFDEYMDFMTLNSKEMYTRSVLNDLKTGKETIDYQDAIDLYHEMVSMEALAVKRGGVNAVADVAGRDELYKACVAEIDGFNASGPIIDKNGAITYGPKVGKMTLSHQIASKSQKDALQGYVDKGYSCAESAKKLLAKDVLLKSDIAGFYKEIADRRKFAELKDALTPYMTYDALNEFVKTADLNKMVTEAEKYYEKVDLNHKFDYRGKDGLNHYRYGVKCSEGKINLQQKTELNNYSRNAYFMKLKNDVLQANGGKELSGEAIEKINKTVDECMFERSVQIDNMSYKEAKAEVGKLPVSLRQKFELEKMLLVPHDQVISLTRDEANVMITKVRTDMQSKEVSKDILEFAKKYNLVVEGQPYTYKNWNEDCKKVPGMDDLKELAEKLNLQSNLLWRKENVHNGKFPLDNCQFTHDDYVAVITSYYTKADERFNGPVMDYQVKAVPEAQKCDNWQQAEKLYLERCVLNNLIGEDEARFLLNADRKFVNCPSDKLLDTSLSLDERKAAAVEVRNVVQEKMAQNRISIVSSAYIAPSSEKDLTDAGKCVRYAINQIVGRVDNAADYITRTSGDDKIESIARVTFDKVGFHAPVGTPANKEIAMVASAIMYSTPGLVGKAGSSRERYSAVYKTVAKVKNSLEASKNNVKEHSKGAKVERRRSSELTR